MTFLKSLITSDFSSVNPMFLKKETAPIRATAGFSKQQLYATLDLLTLNRSLKQFIRTLQFFNKKRGLFTLFIKDAHFYFLASEFLSALIKPARLFVRSEVRKSDVLPLGRKFANPALLLDKEFSSTNYLKKFHQNNYRLITSIDLTQNMANYGRYHTQNDLLSMEKRTYTAVLLRGVLKVPAGPLKPRFKKKNIKKVEAHMKAFIQKTVKLLPGQTSAISKKKKKIKTINKKKFKVVNGVFTKLELFKQKQALSFTE